MKNLPGCSAVPSKIEIGWVTDTVPVSVTGVTGMRPWFDGEGAIHEDSDDDQYLFAHGRRP